MPANEGRRNETHGSLEVEDTFVLLDWKEDKSEGGVTECIGLLGEPSLIWSKLARHHDGYEIRFSRYICASTLFLPWRLST